MLKQSPWSWPGFLLCIPGVLSPASLSVHDRPRGECRMSFKVSLFDDNTFTPFSSSATPSEQTGLIELFCSPIDPPRTRMNYFQVLTDLYMYPVYLSCIWNTNCDPGWPSEHQIPAAGHLSYSSAHLNPMSKTKLLIFTPSPHPTPHTLHACLLSSFLHLGNWHYQPPVLKPETWQLSLTPLSSSPSKPSPTLFYLSSKHNE